MLPSIQPPIVVFPSYWHWQKEKDLCRIGKGLAEHEIMSTKPMNV